MYALVCLSVLACAFAAPQYYHPPPPPPPPHHHHHHHGSELNGFFRDSIFDTNKFWSDFSREMSEFEQTMKEFMQHFPKSESTSGLQGNQYKINILLQGFEEKEITVKAREGLIMVQAVHKMEDGGETNYLDIRTLPSFVKADSGSWTYEEKKILKIVFSVKENSISTTEASGTTEEVVSTQEPDREEMESHENENNSQDADVGVRGDNEVDTNEIVHEKAPEAVESSTYAVDFNDDVEFVPVQMRQAAQ